VPPAKGVLLQEITAYFTAPREAVKYVVTPLSVVTVGAAAPADEAGVTEVVLEKLSKDTIFGVVLKDYEHPYVDKVVSTGLAAGKLQAGDQVLSINDWKAVGHHETAERLKQLMGVIRIKVLRSEEGGLATGRKLVKISL
jgi:translation elongation factor EF-G